MNNSYLLQAFVESPWAILPSKLAMLQGIVSRHVSGEKLDAEDIQSRIHGSKPPEQRQVSHVAVLPLFGTIFPRANLMTDISGATSAERFGNAFAQLVNDPEVGAIVLDVDSPGGHVGGVQELAQKIYEARGKKPIIAVANHLMASAAYWIASAADKVVVAPSGEVGSIGVFTVHQDVSKALEQDGVKVSLISAGKHKTEGNPYEPLAEESRASIQERVNEAYEMFVNAVAVNRGVSVDDVKNGFGEGRVVGARQAVYLKMADRIDTLENVLSELLSKQNVTTSTGSNTSAVFTVQEVKSGTEQVLKSDLNQASFVSQAREQLMQAETRYQGELIMNVRELLKEREALVGRGQALANTADAEDRDFTDAERKEFTEIFGGELDGVAVVGKLPEVDGKIAKINDERAKLKAALEANITGNNQAEKPSTSHAKNMKRVDFDKLDAGAQSAFIRAGGKLEE